MDLTPDEVADEYRALQVRAESGGLGKSRPDLAERYEQLKFLAGIDLNDSPEAAGNKAAARAANSGASPEEAEAARTAASHWVALHGRRRHSLALDSLVALAWADFTGRGGTPTVANAERLSRDVARLSLAFPPDEVLSLVSGHVTRLSLGRS